MNHTVKEPADAGAKAAGQLLESMLASLTIEERDQLVAFTSGGALPETASDQLCYAVGLFAVLLGRQQGACDVRAATKRVRVWLGRLTPAARRTLTVRQIIDRVLNRPA